MADAMHTEDAGRAAAAVPHISEGGLAAINRKPMLRKACAYWAGFLKGVLANGAVEGVEIGAVEREASRFCALFEDRAAQDVAELACTISREARRDGAQTVEAALSEALAQAEAALERADSGAEIDAINRFLGLCAGVVADGDFCRREAEAILSVDDRAAVVTSAPCARILDAVERAMADDDLDPEEASDIRDLIVALVGNAYGQGSIGEAHWPEGTVTDPGDLELDGASLVLTGPMRLGPRREIITLIEARGGRVATSVSRKVDYVVIAEAASAFWRQTHYGTKIEKAANLIADGADLRFVAEEALEALLCAPTPSRGDDAEGQELCTDSNMEHGNVEAGNGADGGAEITVLRDQRNPTYPAVVDAEAGIGLAEPEPPAFQGPDDAVDAGEGAASGGKGAASRHDGAMRIRARVAPKITLATHQNDFPTLVELTVENTGDEDLDNLRLELVADPPVIGARSWTIDRIAAGGAAVMRDKRVQLAGGYLDELTERMRADVTFRLTRGGDVLAEERSAITALARNEWGGASTMPELLAAFVTPNDPGVAGVLRDASLALKASNEDPALDGYQAGSRKRVWTLAAAIWSAIAARQLTYAEPPASFERDGQKIRLPSVILGDGLATCLDTSALFAACLEQIGLNPVIAFTKGHAFCGVWLQPQSFPSLTVEEAADLRKALDEKELILFETTLVTSGHSVGFAKAVRDAARQIAIEDEDDFVYALDLRQARGRQIQPLASVAAATAGGAHGDAAGPAPIDLPPDDLPGFDFGMRHEAAPETPDQRTDLWRRRLLDLSKRNRLLNLRKSSTVIPIFCTDLADLEDQLSSGRRIAFVTPPPSPKGELGKDATLYRLRTGDDLSESYAQDQLARGAVVAELDDKALDAGLVNLFRKAKSDIEEGGSNTLFLAIGMLRWTPVGQTTAYRAPLIMKPVKLERASAKTRPGLRGHDDDTVVNMTLLEMLRRDFEITIPELADGLPEDDAGVDVKAILAAVRRAVRDTSGMEVMEEVCLSTFSFAKYLMWKDLTDRAEQLRAAPFVRHLVDNPRDPYAHGARFLDAREIDARIDLADLHLPFNADSSQIVAVHASGGDGDFVLEGPPGTGKSETICNIIAHNLALGRKVLFVSEKMAALEVVRERMANRGLGQFCLDLHANHANKKAVIDHLGRSWAAAAGASAQDWRERAARLATIRDALNDLVGALHARGRTGVSPREAIGRAARYGGIHALRLDWPMDLLQGDRADSAEALAQLEQIAHRAGQAWGQLEAEDARAFAMVGATEWSHAWVARMREAAKALGAETQALRRDLEALQHAFGLGPQDPGTIDPARLEALADVARAAVDPDAIRLGFALEPAGRADVEALGLAIQAQKAWLDARAAFEQGRKARPIPVDRIRGADVEAWRAAREAAEVRRWPMRSVALGRLGKAVATTLGCKPGRAAVDLIEPVAELRAALEAAEKAGRDVPRGAPWKGLDTDPRRAGELLLKAEALRMASLRLGAGLDGADLRGALRRVFVDGADGLEPGLPMHDAASALVAAHARFTEARSAFLREAQAGQRDDTLAALEEACGLIAARGARLNDWVAWLGARRDAEQAGLRALITSLESGTTPPGAALEAFRTAYRIWIAPLLIDADPRLREFQAVRHEEMISTFRALDMEMAAVTADHIRATLSGAVPSRSASDLPAGFAALTRELSKKARHKPVRKLVSDMGPSLLTLTPCVMMSPLSVAQFLPPDASLFDLVVFDEASQITVADAVGAIARGRRTIIVGDPKQMPPTSFFDKAAEETEDDDAADLESILDEALSSGAPLHRLTGHYRSRHESLIAFSNHAYYDSALVTYPSADTRESAVSFRRVNGVYARGKARTNAVEARAVAEEVVRRLKDPVLSRLSLGVVTFNAEQQRLVMDLLDRARREDPELEAFFADDADDAVFVKNLETVQGDQRDVILISVGYGPTEPGSPTMPMNFGPLNRNGGERRLNVAITRATTEVVIFASFDPTMIDLSRTKARAVHDLRTYLDFAARGPVALGQALSSFGSDDAYDSDFEMAVAIALRERGWTVRTQVGVSRFRVDLGIVHPDEPGRFLAGVECDGATYHGSPTARDRDRVRQAVLERLGWRLERVWSTDFFIDPRARMDRLHEALTAILEADRQRLRDAEKERASHEEGAVEVGPSVIDADETLAMPARPPLALGSPGEDRRPAQENLALGWSGARNDDVEDAEIIADDGPGGDEAATPPQDRDGRNAGESADAWRPAARGTPPAATAAETSAGGADVFYADEEMPRLRSRLFAIIDAEGPVTAESLTLRIARDYGMQRTGGVIRARVAKAVGRHRPSSKDRAGVTIWWPQGATPAPRVAWRKHLERDWRDIPEPELVDIAAKRLTVGDPVRAIAAALGIQRLRASTRTELEDLLEIAGKLEREE